MTAASIGCELPTEPYRPELLDRAALSASLPAPPTSTARFPDGGAWRLEIPSVEGLDALQTVIATAEEERITIHRVSQGSGVWLHSDGELTEMVAASREHKIDLCLFIRPGAGWDVGAAKTTTVGTVGGRTRGLGGLSANLAELQRGCELGVRSFLVADEGLLWTAHRLRVAGEIEPE